MPPQSRLASDRNDNEETGQYEALNSRPLRSGVRLPWSCRPLLAAQLPATDAAAPRAASAPVAKPAETCMNDLRAFESQMDTRPLPTEIER